MTDIPDLPPVLERLLDTGNHDQIGAYALDALPAEERIAFEAHLRHCHQCQDELPVLLDAARFLRQAIVPDRYPAEPAPTGETNAHDTSFRAGAIDEQRTLRPGPEDSPAEQPATDASGPEQAIDQDVAPTAFEETAEPWEAATDDRDVEPLAAETETVQEAPSAEEPATGEPAAELPDLDATEPLLGIPAATDEETALPTAEEIATRPSRRRRAPGRIAPGAAPTPMELAAAPPRHPSRLPWIVAVLGLLFGVGAIIAALALAETKSNLEEEIAFQNSQIEELNTQRDEYLQQTTAITWEMVPTTLGTPDSGGTVFADPAGTSAILSVFGMAPPGDDQMYQVWYVLPDDTSVAGPALTIDSNGNAVVPLQPDLSPYKALAVTIEPASGSELPSTNPVLQTFFGAE